MEYPLIWEKKNLGEAHVYLRKILTMMTAINENTRYVEIYYEFMVDGYEKKSVRER